MQTLIDAIANILRVPGDYLRELTLMIPHSAARTIFILYFAALLVWVLTMPKSEVCGVLPGKKEPIDLRPYAAAALIGQIMIYSLFS